MKKGIRNTIIVIAIIIVLILLVVAALVCSSSKVLFKTSSFIYILSKASFKFILGYFVFLVKKSFLQNKLAILEKII